MEREDLPMLLTVKQAAIFWRVSPGEVYRNPQHYGGKRIRGKGRWRFPRDVLFKIAGIGVGSTASLKK